VAVSRRIRRGYLAAWLLLVAAVVVPLVVRTLTDATGPAVAVVGIDGRTETITLQEMKSLSTLVRGGVYQNQYGNWRDEGVYAGVRLVDLLGADARYETIRVVAEDGYAVTVERARVEDQEFPMVLAYALDGIEVPGWADGFRIAVLPTSGRVGNEAYGVESAGSYWVKNVERIVLQ